VSDVADFVRRQLGHKAKDLSLFELALTHSSVAGNQSYERLEFLGDRVLGLVIAQALYARYPTEPEGSLSKRYNGLVDRVTCAENGREIGVPAFIRLGKQAREDGASQSDNVVGDVKRRAPQHPKSSLQELAAARNLKPPMYEVVSRTGAHHAPKFTIRVSVPKLGEATAEGTSKQEAETAAAAALLSQVK
jgi:ribonuclease-3